MLSNGFGKPLHLKCKPSHYYLLLIILSHSLAVFALWVFTAMTLGIQLGLSIGLTLYAGYLCFRHFHDDRYWVWQSDDTWLCVDEPQQTWFLQPKRIVTAWFVIMTLSYDKRSELVLVFKDQIDKTSFRRLRVRLRYYHVKEAVSALIT